MWAYRRRSDGKYEIYNKQTGETDGKVYDTPTAALQAISAANKGLSTPLPAATPITVPPPSGSTSTQPGSGGLGAYQDLMSRTGNAAAAGGQSAGADPYAPPPSSKPAKRQWEGYSETELRHWYRAQGISWEQWRDELIARGNDPEQAVAKISQAMTIGLSTAKDAPPGTLTAAEKAKVDALRPLVEAERQRVAAAQGGGGGSITANSGGATIEGVDPKALATLYDAAAKAGFRGDALHRAVATALAESPGARVGKWSDTNMAGESSIGPMQINLDAHAADIPGATRAEKIAWLQNPYNAMVASFRISSGGTDFSPWSVWHEAIKTADGKTLQVGAPAAKLFSTLASQQAAATTPAGAATAGVASLTPSTPFVNAGPPRYWDFGVTPEGQPYVYIYETDEAYALPEGTTEDNVTAIYTVLNNLPPDSPNLAMAMADFEAAKLDQGVDEFDRPYYDAATDASTRYNAPPLPEALPAYMQKAIIRSDVIDEDKFAEDRGLNFTQYGDPRFARMPSAQLAVDYGELDNGVTGPVFANTGRVFANLTEAQAAEIALGQELASMSISTADRREQNRISAGGEVFEEQKGGQYLKEPPDFAFGGSMQLRRPTLIVDEESGEVIANAAVNGPERVSFGGEAGFSVPSPTPGTYRPPWPPVGAWGGGWANGYQRTWNLGRDEPSSSEQFFVNPNGQGVNPSFIRTANPNYEPEPASVQAPLPAPVTAPVPQFPMPNDYPSWGEGPVLPRRRARQLASLGAAY